ncbi:glycosyl hydrolase [Propioniciclava soli]|uniref:glucan endo-1,3-beta-D-glucosidase n=1 Tax=Propioniciclava soli TaxID=2775081 RepID=A0ABZ3CAV9_9ACTN|nr:glycosyl hydrolase [Propioniciclava soli]
MKALRPVALAAALVLTLGACTGIQPQGTAPSETPAVSGGDGAVFEASALAEQVAALPQEEGLDLQADRLADGLVPPTNRWFSGLVFGEEPMPVFPMPYAFGLTDAGFGFNLPVVTAAEKVITGPYAPEITLLLPDAPAWQVSAYDTATVTLTDTVSHGSLVLAQGSPFLTFTADAATELTSSGAVWAADGDRWTTTVGDHTWVLLGEGVRVAGESISVDAGGHATWFALPEGGDADALAALAAPVTGSTLSYTVEGEEASTTLSYATAGGETAVAAMPHQASTDCSLGTYASIYGTLAVCAGSELTWTSPTQPANAGLDLAGLSDAQRAELGEALVADVASDPDYPADTYFGGKALQRDAMLWQIATQLGDEASAATLRAKIVETMDLWTDPERCASADAFCFVYDTTNRGVVGRVATFDADRYNDHHFHYGYFLYAAGVLAADDPELAERWAPVMDLLAADIASSEPNDFFPERRTFDVYASHSWASGTSPFADGNNQESVSEAINAWAGLTLWARASGNDPLEVEGTWLQALEAQAARAYWTDFDTTEPAYDGFAHQITSLVWGGKRDYATWFSAEPAAMLAILVIPASPSSEFLAGDSERIRANVAEATATGGYAQTYGDYLLMYRALAGQEDAAEALDTARSLPDEFIDDGNSRTYLLAFCMAQAT